MDFSPTQGDKIVISSFGFDNIETITLVPTNTPDIGQFGYFDSKFTTKILQIQALAFFFLPPTLTASYFALL